MKLKKENVKCVICSVDKDLNQIPGWHYDYNKQEKFWITEEEALKNLYCQIIAGDSSDNVEGIKGLGKKTAEKLLAKCKSNQDYYTAVLSVYKEKYPESYEERLTEMAQLVYILRSENDSWKPPT